MKDPGQGVACLRLQGDDLIAVRQRAEFFGTLFAQRGVCFLCEHIYYFIKLKGLDYFFIHNCFSIDQNYSYLTTENRGLQ